MVPARALSSVLPGSASPGYRGYRGRAVVTFGERHVYVLSPAHDGPPTTPLSASAKKAFHVSPFFTLDGTYRFVLPAPDALLAADIDLEVAGVRDIVGDHTISATTSSRSSSTRP